MKHIEIKINGIQTECFQFNKYVKSAVGNVTFIS